MIAQNGLSWIGYVSFFSGGALGLLSLFFFSMASAGFILFMVKYPRGSEVRLWGIRLCHAFGFCGVGFRRLLDGMFTEPVLLVVYSLVVSLVAFEIGHRFLKTG